MSGPEDIQLVFRGLQLHSGQEFRNEGKWDLREAVLVTLSTIPYNFSRFGNAPGKDELYNSLVPALIIRFGLWLIANGYKDKIQWEVLDDAWRFGHNVDGDFTRSHTLNSSTSEEDAEAWLAHFPEVTPKSWLVMLGLPTPPIPTRNGQGTIR
jgi:hypothetical protein